MSPSACRRFDAMTRERKAAAKRQHRRHLAHANRDRAYRKHRGEIPTYELTTETTEEKRP